MIFELFAEIPGGSNEGHRKNLGVEVPCPGLLELSGEIRSLPSETEGWVMGLRGARALWAQHT